MNRWMGNTRQLSPAVFSYRLLKVVLTCSLQVLHSTQVSQVRHNQPNFSSLSCVHFALQLCPSGHIRCWNTVLTVFRDMSKFATSRKLSNGFFLPQSFFICPDDVLAGIHLQRFVRTRAKCTPHRKRRSSGAGAPFVSKVLSACLGT